MQTFDKPYVVNGATLYLHKSSRRNSTISGLININHLISTANGKIDDIAILNQLINTVEKAVYYSKRFNRHIEATCYVNVGKQSTSINANLEEYKDVEVLSYSFIRQKFSSIEELINFIYSIYNLIYPYNQLNLSELHRNTSIRALINKYYN